MNIYQVNRYDYVVSKNEKEAAKDYNRIVNKSSPFKKLEGVRLLSERELEQNMLGSDDPDHPESRSFKVALKRYKKPVVLRRYTNEMVGAGI